MAISKYSRQRELIYKAVTENRVHPTAEFIYNYLKKDNPQLSLGTVYRNLQQLSDKGSIRRLSIPDQPDRFDGVMDKHYHAVCERCGNVDDIFCSEFSSVEKDAAEKTGLTIVGHDIVFKSICRSCEDKTANKGV
ncbi:MAG: transcriptional repressor [Mucispirillum sp.]|nr:transcriptional repressor [Mucispirillum sp.]